MKRNFKRGASFCVLMIAAICSAMIFAPRTVAADDKLCLGNLPENIIGVAGDLMVFSYTADCRTDVAGDVLGVSFTELNIRRSVGGNVRTASGTFLLEADIYKNITTFAGNIKLSDKACVWGNAYLAAGDAVINGTVKNNLYLYSQNVVINGNIEGDLVLHTGYGRVQISESATIKGNIYHYGAFPLEGQNLKNYNFYNTGDGRSVQRPILHGIYSFVIFALVMMLLYLLFGRFYMYSRSLEKKAPIKLVLSAMVNFIKLLAFLVAALFLSALGIIIGAPIKGIWLFAVVTAVLTVLVFVCINTFFCYVFSRIFKKMHPIAVAVLGTLSFAFLYTTLSLLSNMQNVGVIADFINALLCVFAYLAGSVIVSRGIKKAINSRLRREKNEIS